MPQRITAPPTHEFPTISLSCLLGLLAVSAVASWTEDGLVSEHPLNRPFSSSVHILHPWEVTYLRHPVTRQACQCVIARPSRRTRRWLRYQWVSLSWYSFSFSIWLCTYMILISLSGFGSLISPWSQLTCLKRPYRVHVQMTDLLRIMDL